MIATGRSYVYSILNLINGLNNLAAYSSRQLYALACCLFRFIEGSVRFSLI